MSWLKTMLSEDDTVSSKRVITFLAFLLCSVAFVADLIWGLKVDFPVFQSMMYIVIAGLGFTASEKFAQKSK
jgi:hypothetical protein